MDGGNETEAVSGSEVTHQQSHSPLHAHHHTPTDPTLSLSKTSSAELNSRKRLPPIQLLPSKKDSSLNDNSDESSSDEDTVTSKPTLIDRARAVSGSMREVVRVVREDGEKELISIDCQTDMTWVDHSEKRPASRTIAHTPKGVEASEKEPDLATNSAATLMPRKLSVGQHPMGHSATTIRATKAISNVSLLNKSVPILKDFPSLHKERYATERKDSLGSSSDDDIGSTTTEDFDEEFAHETVPSIGPPTILQYHRESEEKLLQTNIPLRSPEISDVSEEPVASTGMFEGLCEFCHQEVKTFPTVEDQKKLSPEDLFCCERYRDFISFVIEASKGNGEAVLHTDTDGAVSPTSAATAIAAQSSKFAKDVAAKRMLERQLSKNKAVGMRSSRKPSMLSSKPDAMRSSAQGNNLRLATATSNLTFDQGGPQFLRQIKTISYQLSSVRCLEEGWTLRPSSPFFDDKTAVDYSDIFELDANTGPWPQHADMAATERSVIVKYYDDGNVFLVRFLDGTGTIYYPNGRPAINICLGSASAGLLFIIHSDADESPVSGYFDTRGFAATNYDNDHIRLCLKPLGGVEVSGGGARKRKWRWTDEVQHVHAPPIQPLTIALSSQLAVRIMARDNIVLTFNCSKKSCRLHVGAKLKMLNSEQVLPQEPTDKSQQFRKDIKQRAKELLSKISYILSHPCAPVTLPPLPIVPGTSLSFQPDDQPQSATVRTSLDTKDKKRSTARNRKDLPPIIVN